MLVTPCNNCNNCISIPQNSPESSEPISRGFNDLTLAEKIRLEQQQKQKGTAPTTIAATSRKPPSLPPPPVTEELYPPLAPGLALFKSESTTKGAAQVGGTSVAPAASKKPVPKPHVQTGGWEAALSSTGIEVSGKKKKKGSGLTVVKPRKPTELMTSTNSVEAPPAPATAMPPPPGFGQLVPTGKLCRDQMELSSSSTSMGKQPPLSDKQPSLSDTEMKYDPSDYPSLCGSSVNVSTAASWGPSPAPAPKSAKSSLKVTEVSDSGKFPGSWVTVGGSRGAASAEHNPPKANPAISDDDFPSLGGGDNGGKVQKKQKRISGKNKDLQNLAFGIR